MISTPQCYYRIMWLYYPITAIIFGQFEQITKKDFFKMAEIASEMIESDSAEKLASHVKHSQYQ